MALSHVSDGGVQFARVDDKPGEDPCTSNCTATQGDVIWKDGFDEVTKEFTTKVKDYLDNDIAEIENTLLGSLSTQHKLFLPASGTFLMKDPMFNLRGDLLVTVTYNGYVFLKPARHREKIIGVRNANEEKNLVRTRRTRRQPRILHCRPGLQPRLVLPCAFGRGILAGVQANRLHQEEWNAVGLDVSSAGCLRKTWSITVIKRLYITIWIRASNDIELIDIKWNR
jgi:hypothetical protein